MRPLSRIRRAALYRLVPLLSPLRQGHSRGSAGRVRRWRQRSAPPRTPDGTATHTGVSASGTPNTSNSAETQFDIVDRRPEVSTKGRRADNGPQPRTVMEHIVKQPRSAGMAGIEAALGLDQEGLRRRRKRRRVFIAFAI